MAISAITSNATDGTLTQPKDAVGKKDMDQQDFMKLFITQLQYQDPMKPMDNYEMASQMAQFSSLQATQKMSTDMENLLNFQTSQNNLQLLSMLGNDAQITGNIVGVVDGKASPTDFVLDQPASSTTVTIYNDKNQVVWQRDMGTNEAGTYNLAWDCKNGAGQSVADGAYHYEVKAMTATGEQLSVTTHSSGKVTGIVFDKGGATVTLDNLSQALVSDIIKVQTNSTPLVTTTVTPPTGGDVTPPVDGAQPDPPAE